MVNSTLLNSPVKAGFFLKRLLAVFLLSSSFFSVYAHPLQGGEEKVTIKEKDVPLRAVFKLIRKQTGYNFFYTQAYVNDERKVSLDVEGASVDNVLQRLLGGEYEWVYNEEAVSIRKKKLEEERSNVIDTIKNSSKERISVSGKVTDANGNPVPGATILIKGTKEGVNANDIGEFTLSDVGMNTALVISSIGYEKREVVVRGKTIITRLNLDVNDLDEAVVQAYGTTTRRLTTSNITQVTAEEIERQPVMNPLLTLQGKVPGLDVSLTSGYASAPLKVELRGRSTVGEFPSDPLYIVDGVPLTVLDIGGAGYPTSRGFIQNGITGPANGQSPLFSINPADIESIAVLKDADATAIYGSRGANGVIIITTKKGKSGKSQFDIHTQQGITRVTRFWNMLNTEQYLQVRREAFANDLKRYGAIDGQTVPGPDNAYDLLQWDTSRYTDWQRALYGGTGKATDAQLSFSGGDTHTTFRIAAGYNRTTAITTVNGADQKTSVSFNMSHRSDDQRFSASLSTVYSYSKSDMISLPGSVIMPPNAPAIFDSAGKLNYEEWRITRNFPFTSLLQPYVSKTNFLNSSLNLSYQIMPGLSISSSFGYNNAQMDQVNTYPIISLDPASNPTGSAYFGKNSNRGWIIEPQFAYDLSIGKGKLNALLGASIQQTATAGLSVYGGGYTNDDLLKTITNAPTIVASDYYGQYKYAALFGRITYNWANKYIVNLNARRDGSSKFGPGKQYGNFGSVGAAWIFTEESWLKDKLSFLSFGKLRGSYGTTGSDAIGDYQYLTRWSSENLPVYNGILPIAPIQNANPNYQWQVNKKLEGAFELGFLNDRFNLNVAYYRNRCGNQLIQFPTPAFTGFTSVAANSPALVQNTGWEFSASARVIDGKDFKWTLSFNTSINRNKLLAYPDLASSPYASTYVVGEPLNITKRLRFIGVDPKTGFYTFEDKNKNGEISTSPGDDDDRYVVDLNPSFFGGVGMNVSFKDIQLNMVFNIRKQVGPNALSQGGNVPGTLFNQPIDVLTSNRWRNSGDASTYAAFTTVPFRDNSYANYAFRSDAGYTDASFIRLSNLSLSYNLPAMWMRKVRIKSCRVFMHANNLFVLTKYKGVDPETQNFGGLPPAKTIVGGLSFSF